MSKQLVIYTDGGCKPSRGVGGWGIHGYSYIAEKPKQGSGCKGYHPTATGYLSNACKNEEDLEVTVVSYIDVVGSLPAPSTNNEAELTAMLESLRYIEREQVETVTILADSTYVIDGITEYLPRWIKNRWTKPDGSEVANKHLWMEIHTTLDRLKGKVNIQFQWVKGHSGNPGNDVADELASRGIIVGRRNEVINDLILKAPQGYWNREVEYNPLLCQKYWLFTNHGLASEKSNDGEYFVYYMFDLGQNVDISLIDKKLVDASFTVLFLKEPDPVMEELRTYQHRFRAKVLNGLVVGRLDNIQRPSFYSEALEYGCKFVEQAGYKCDLYDYKYNQLTNEMVPVGQGNKANDSFAIMEQQLSEIIDESEVAKLTLTDITDVFYETTVKGKKTTVKIRKEFDTTTKDIDVTVGYTLPTLNKQWIKSETSIKLLFNNDLFKRNAISNIADIDTRIYVVTWLESPTAIRYGTLVKSKFGYSFTQSPFANIKLVI